MLYRVGINYGMILQNHIFTNTEQNYMMLLPFEGGMFFSFIVTLNAFDVRPTCHKSHKICLRVFGGNGSIAWTSAVSHVGRTSNAFKVTMKLQVFLFQMVVTSCISVQYL